MHSSSIVHSEMNTGENERFRLNIQHFCCSANQIESMQFHPIATDLLNADRIMTELILEYSWPLVQSSRTFKHCNTTDRMMMKLNAPFYQFCHCLIALQPYGNRTRSKTSEKRIKVNLGNMISS